MNAKIYQFPSPDTHENSAANSGPVWKEPRLYRCAECGNTRLFLARAELSINAKVSIVTPFHYDINSISVSKQEDENHEVYLCAECGSSGVEVYCLRADSGTIELVPMYDFPGARVRRLIDQNGGGVVGR